MPPIPYQPKCLSTRMVVRNVVRSVQKKIGRGWVGAGALGGETALHSRAASWVARHEGRSAGKEHGGKVGALHQALAEAEAKHVSHRPRQTHTHLARPPGCGTRRIALMLAAPPGCPAPRPPRRWGTSISAQTGPDPGQGWMVRM